MTTPTIRTYIDWDNTLAADPDHDFTADSRARMRDTIMTPLQVSRGRSLDFSGDMTGQLTFRIKAGRSAGCYPRQVLMTPGLVGYWHLGEASGTAAANLAGGADGTYTGTPTLGATGPLTGDSTTAVTLNGTTQYVTVADSTTLDLGDGPLSIAAWVKRSSTGTEDAIVGKGSGGYYLYIGSDNKVYLADQGTADVAGTTVTITDTSWHLVVATYAGTTTGKIYIDGVDRTTSTASSTIANTAIALGIGSQSGASAAAPFAGSLAHVALWDVALTQAQVTELYTAGTTAPIFPAYDKIGRGDIMLGRRVLVLADYLTDTDKPLFSGRITRMYRDPLSYDIEVVCTDDSQAFSADLPGWESFEGTFRELRMDIIRRVQTVEATYSTNLVGGLNPNGGASRSYWTSVPVNRVSNPGFETNTTGWNITTDAKVLVAATSITRTASGKHGSWKAVVVIPAGTSTSGTWTDLSSYTFEAGKTYRYSVWVSSTSLPNIYGHIYSNGTPTDGANDNHGILSAGVYRQLTGTWTPSADRTDVHFAIYAGQEAGTALSLYVDSVAVWCMDSAEGAWYELSYADPLGLSSVARESTITRQTGTGPLNLGTFIRAAASSGASVAVPLQAPLAWAGGTPEEGGTATPLVTWAAGTYTATAYVRGAGTGYLRFGRQPGTVASSGAVTLNASTWAQAHVHVTLAGGEKDVWFVADTTGATLEIAGLVITAGSTEWAWCPTVGMDGLDTTEDGMRVCRVTPEGTPLDILTALNGASFTHHWIEPLAVHPWWRYRTACPAALTGKTVAETFDDDVQGHTGSVQSYDSLVNVVHYTSGTGYFDGDGVYQTGVTDEGEVTDATSVALWGRQAVDISSGYLEPQSTALTTIPDYILDLYAVPRQRFSFIVENRWPSQLLRELDDLIVLTLPRIGLVNGRFIIVGITHDITSNGYLWRTTYQVEAVPPT